MANLDGPRGFRPVEHNSGGTPHRMGAYKIESTLAENIYYGDCVKSTGVDNRISLCAAGDDIRGVFAGVSYVDAAGRPKFQRYWASGTVGTEIVAYVFDDPEQVFSVQATTFANTDVNKFADLQVGTGSATTGNSGAEINDGTLAASRTSETFKVLDKVNSPDNDYGANCDVKVIAVGHELG